MKVYECSFCHDVNAWVTLHKVDLSEKYNLPEGYLVESRYYCSMSTRCIQAVVTWELELTHPELRSNFVESLFRLWIPITLTALWLTIVLILR